MFTITKHIYSAGSNRNSKEVEFYILFKILFSVNILVTIVEFRIFENANTTKIRLNLFEAYNVEDKWCTNGQKL